MSCCIIIDETTIEKGNAILEIGFSKGPIAIVKIGEKSVEIKVD